MEVLWGLMSEDKSKIVLASQNKYITFEDINSNTMLRTNRGTFQAQHGVILAEKEATRYFWGMCLRGMDWWQRTQSTT